MKFSWKLSIIAAILISLSLLTIAQTRSTRNAIARKISVAAVTKPAKLEKEQQSISTASLPLRRIILYSNGVAYFERRDPLTDRSETNLPLKQSQVDDVLKSLVVLLHGNGRAAALSYNSSP